MAYINVSNIRKAYRIVQPTKGVFGAVKGLFHQEYKLREAVRDVSFTVDQGEIVGYIGPNGAGKSTTIKMLAGVLVPDAGHIDVNGVIPYENRRRNAQHIGVIFGQRSQLYWDLPVEDTFELYQKLYDIPFETYKRNREAFIEILDMTDFMYQPVRQLSLGQKMKANLALALLHEPKVVYLDEPTIGLDVMSKHALRDSIRALNGEKGTTIMLTTHDMGDVEALCNRLILIDKGVVLFDGALKDFKERHAGRLSVTLTFEAFPRWKEDDRFDVPAVNEEERTWTINVLRDLSARDALMLLIERYAPVNVGIQEQRIEDIIHHLFEKEA